MWWVIICAIIVTFVVWGTQTSQNGGGGGRGSYGRINDETITFNKFFAAQREVYLNYFFMSGGSWPDRGRKLAGFDLERETYFRLLMIQKLERMGVHISDDVVARVASERLRSLNRGKPLPPDVFTKQVLAPQSLSLADFERYLRHELGIQQLVSVLGLGGELITPQEMRALYTRENQEVQTQVAFFAATNYLDGLKPTPDQLSQFYTNQMARYRLPDRIQVNYVRFALTNFLTEAQHELDQITNLNEIIEARYEDLGSNYFSEAKSPAEAKQKIREQALHETALAAARKQAVAFANELFNQTPVNPDNLATLAKAKGLVPQVTPPFSNEEPPEGLDVRADFLHAAFNLSAEEPYSQTLVGNDGVYLISLNKTLPSEIPPLAAIHDQVTRDYRFNEALKLARQAALHFAATGTNITSTAAFTAACAVAKVKPLTLPPFALSTRTLAPVEQHVPLSQFKQAVFSTPVGRMSQLHPSSDGAYAVFVQAKLPLDEAKIAAAMPAFQRTVRQARRGEAFHDWFRHEAEKGFREVPYFQQQAQMTGLPKQ